MALAHTILMLLTESAYTGYELSKEFDEKVSCYWQATSQQIYRELARMQKQGWVDAEVIPQEGRPDKKYYSITPQGKAELTHWLHSYTEPAAIREDVLVKVKAGELIPREVLIRELEHRRELHSAQLTQYREFEREGFADPETLPVSKRLHYLGLRRGMRYEQEWIDWCDEAIAVIKDLPES